MGRKGLLRRIAGVRLGIAIQVFTTLLILAVGYFAIEQNLRWMARSKEPIPVSEIKSSLQRIRVEVLLVAFVAFLSGVVLAYTINKQLKGVTKGLERIAKGNLDPDLSPKPSEDFLPLDSAVKKLADSLNLFLHQSITDAIVMLDERYRIEAFNPTAEYLFGYKAEEVQGASLSMLFPNDERNRILYESLLVPQRESGGWGEQIQGTILTQNGDAVSVRVSTFQIRVEGSKSLGLVIGVFDVKEFRKVREEIERTEHLSSLGMFVTGLAHEIKNPLGAIKGLVELLDEDIPYDHPRKTYCATILNEVHRLDSVMRSLLDFGSSREGPVHPIEIDSTLREILTLMQAETEKKSLFVETHLSTPSPVLIGNADRIRMAFLNILKNAIEATPPLGRLSIRKEVDGDEVVVSIANPGTPISPEEREKVFHPFYTKKGGGTGLGLAIAHQIIRAHQGRIHLRDFEGGGTLFEIHLPLKGIRGSTTASQKE